MERKDFSIGLYSIDNLQELRGREGYGFSVDLWRINQKIAHIEDYGDGAGENVHFYPEARMYEETVLKEMNMLLEILKPVLSPDGLWTSFTATPYAAANGFSELLMDFRELVKIAKRVTKDIPENTYYVLGMMGSSWFTNEDIGKGSTVVSFSTGTSDYNKAVERMRMFEEKNRDKNGAFKQVAILNSQIDWNLNFKDYFELCNVNG